MVNYWFGAWWFEFLGSPYENPMNGIVSEENPLRISFANGPGHFRPLVSVVPTELQRDAWGLLSVPNAGHHKQHGPRLGEGHDLLQGLEDPPSPAAQLLLPVVVVGVHGVSFATAPILHEHHSVPCWRCAVPGCPLKTSDATKVANSPTSDLLPLPVGRWNTYTTHQPKPTITLPPPPKFNSEFSPEKWMAKEDDSASYWVLVSFGGVSC